MTKHVEQMSSPCFTGRSYKNMFKPKKTTPAGDVRRKDGEQVGGDGAPQPTLTPLPVQPELVEPVAGSEKPTPSSSSEGLRITEACSSDASHVPCGGPFLEKDYQSAPSREIPSHGDFGMENGHKTCTCCGVGGGQLLSCVGKGCGRSFHLSCVDPPFTHFLPVDWHCIECVKKKMELVHSVSQGLERVLYAEGASDDEETEKQYYVKYKGLAPVHGRWIRRRELLEKAQHIYKGYKRRSKRASVCKWEKKWNQPQRLLAKRLLKLPRESNHHDGEKGCSCYEWLVKWTGLGYDKATWELEGAPFLSSPEGMKLIDCFESRHKTKEETDHAEENKRRRNTCELSDLPSGDPDHLDYVNKLLECWHMHQNALIIDGQERTVVVVMFLLFLLNNVGGPLLIVATSTTLSLWEAEFQTWSETVNLVMYQGDRDTRRLIRTLDFYNEGGSIMFQVLLSPSSAFAEDVENLRTIKWEVIVIDEFQLPTMRALTKKFKILAANMKLLVDSCQVKDGSISCHNALSLLDPNYEGTNEDGHIHSSEITERLICFTAYERKQVAVKLTEFWVPIKLSDVQNEQYCASMFSSSLLQCTHSRSDPPVSVHDLLITTRKSCDHPYLVDGSLRSLVDGIESASDRFDVEIQMSGKLQFLNKILPEIERRGLRVVILFNTVDGQVTTGDILDDLVLKFCPDSYSRVGGRLSRHQNQAILELFNDKEKKMLVCLLETRACVSGIKLVSIDFIIIFNSDWDPSNDLNALKKITIESQFKELKIFRLYSPYTVEEKALILAKEGLAVDGNIMTVAHKTCHSILAWGSSHQFARLESNTSSSYSLDQTFAEDVIQELSALLPCSSAKKDSNWCSNRKSKPKNVLTAPLIEGAYQGKDIYLVGELESNSSADLHLLDKPKKFWRKLLEGRNPRWKYVSSPSRRIKRKMDSITSESEESIIPAKSARGKRIASKRRSRVVLEVEDDVPSECAKGCAKLQKVATICSNTRSMDLPFRQRGSEAVESSLRLDVLPDSREGLNDNNNVGNVSVPPDAGNHELESINPGILDIYHSAVSSGLSQVHQSACVDSLQQEMDRLQKAKDEAVKLHDDLDSLLEAECEKKIAEIRSQYDLLRQDAASMMAQTKYELESCHQMTYKQKLLAEAIFRKQNAIIQKQQAIMQDVDEGESVSAILSAFMRITQQCSGLPMVEGNLSAPSQTSLVVQSGAMNPIPFRIEQRLVRSAGKNRGPPSIGSISAPVNSLSRSQTRAPAPHLRSTLPSLPPSAAAPEAGPTDSLEGLS